MNIPNGRYPAVAVPVSGEDGTHVARWGYTKNRFRQVLVYFKITEGEHAGRQLPWFGYFTDAAWERTVQSLRYMGWEGDDLMQLGPLDQKVEVVVETSDDQNGRPQTRIAWVNRLGGGVIQLASPMSEDDLRAFAAGMRNRIRKIPPADAARPRPPAVIPDGDDIPF